VRRGVDRQAAVDGFSHICLRWSVRYVRRPRSYHRAQRWIGHVR
jgi:hypothetical protein